MHPSIHAFIHASILNTRTLEHWNTGTLEHWNTGTLEHWNTGTLEQNLSCGSCIHLEHWNTGTESLLRLADDAEVQERAASSRPRRRIYTSWAEEDSL
jgi:hypothetical protein